MRLFKEEPLLLVLIFGSWSVSEVLAVGGGASKLVDPGNPLAAAPLADWPRLPEGVKDELEEAEDMTQLAEDVLEPCAAIRQGILAPSDATHITREEGFGCWDICQEDSWEMRASPFVALGLLMALVSMAVVEAVNSRRTATGEASWAVGLQLANRVFLQAPLSAGAFLFLSMAGRSLLVMDLDAPAVCVKALFAAAFGPPPALAKLWEYLPVYFGCFAGLLVGLLRWLAAEAIGDGSCGFFCCLCCCRRRQPEDYEHRRPLKGSGPLASCEGHLLCCTVTEISEAHGEVNRIRWALQMGSLLGVALAVDLACMGQPLLTFVAFCGVAAGARASGLALRLSRAEWGGRIRDVQCPFGSDAAMLLSLSGKMGYATNELLEKYGIQAASETVIFLYIAVIAIVSMELPNYGDLALALLLLVLCLFGLAEGLGSAAELASAEIGRYATKKALPYGLGRVMLEDHGDHLNVGVRGSLIQFQDYNGRKALSRLRLRFVKVFRILEVLPVAVGLALWSLGGALEIGYTFGALLAVSWELLHPKTRSGSGWSIAAARVLEPICWPAFTTFAPMRLADPTRDHSEKDRHVNTDGLNLPAWCAIRSLYIMILWIFVLCNPSCLPVLPVLESEHDLRDPLQWQRLAAWLLIAAGGLAGGLFPIVSLYIHGKRQAWSLEDFKKLSQHETSGFDTIPEVMAIPVLYPEWAVQERARDHIKQPLEETPLDKLAALDFYGFGKDLGQGKVLLPQISHLLSGAGHHDPRYHHHDRLRLHGQQGLHSQGGFYGQVPSNDPRYRQHPHGHLDDSRNGFDEYGRPLRAGDQRHGVDDYGRPLRADDQRHGGDPYGHPDQRHGGDPYGHPDQRHGGDPYGHPDQRHGGDPYGHPDQRHGGDPYGDSDQRHGGDPYGDPDQRHGGDPYGHPDQRHGGDPYGHPDQRHGPNPYGRDSHLQDSRLGQDRHGRDRAHLQDPRHPQPAQRQDAVLNLHRELPPLIAMHVRKDAALNLQVPLASLCDPLMTSLDVYFAELVNGVHMKFLNARSEASSRGIGLMVSTIGSQDRFGHEFDLKDQVFMQPVAGRPGAFDIEAVENKGVAYGVLEPTLRGDYVLKHRGSAVVVFEVGHSSDRAFVAYPVMARGTGLNIDHKQPLAEAGAAVQLGHGSHGIDNWNFRAAPGIDAVLLISCMLAIAILTHETDMGRHF